MAKEHVLQESIGGTLISTKTICENCNQYFGNAFDVQLKIFYLKLVLGAAPDLPNGIRKIEFPISLNDGTKFILSAGNTVSLRGIKYLASEKAILTGSTYSPTTVTKIFTAKDGKVGKIRVKELPISNRFDEIPYPRKDYFQAHRAAVKSAINFLRHFETIGQLPLSVNWSALGSAKQFVYNDRDGLHFGPNVVPFIDIRTFAKKWEKRNELSHQFILSNDSKNNKAYLFLTGFNSFSWYFEVYGLFLKRSPFTFVYSKAFLPKRISKTKVYKNAIITEEIIRRIRFVSTTKQSLQFAANKFEGSMDQVLSRITYHSDLCHTQILRKTIRTLGLNHKGKTKAKNTVLDLIANRFSGSANLKEIIALSLRELEKNNITDARKTLPVYRALLKKVVKLYGFPTLKTIRTVHA